MVGKAYIRGCVAEVAGCSSQLTDSHRRVVSAEVKQLVNLNVTSFDVFVKRRGVICACTSSRCVARIDPLGGGATAVNLMTSSELLTSPARLTSRNVSSGGRADTVHVHNTSLAPASRLGDIVDTAWQPLQLAAATVQ